MTDTKPKRKHPPGTSARENRIMRQRNKEWLAQHTPYADPDTLVSALRRGDVELKFPDVGKGEGR